MPGRVKLLPRARRDLETLPIVIQDQIMAKLEVLRDFPEIGPAMFDAFQGYRLLPAARDTYRIVFRIVSNDLIEVACIRQTTRQTRLQLIRR